MSAREFGLEGFPRALLEMVEGQLPWGWRRGDWRRSQGAKLCQSFDLKVVTCQR